MTHVRTSPYYPQSNGKMERWYKTLKGDCIRVKVPLTLEDAQRIVRDFVAHYNEVRLHSALGYITPKDRLQGKHTEIFEARDRKLVEARQRRQQLRQAKHEQRHGQATAPQRPAIDFDAVRAAITIADVLHLLGFCPHTTHGAQQRGPCPLHGSTSGTSRCFSVNHTDRIFHCFKCGRSGNALDLWAQANRLTPYDAAVDLCQRLNIPLPALASAHRNREEEPVPLGTTTCTMESN
jgi:Integrase core domain/CHC2 zinc finger